MRRFTSFFALLFLAGFVTFALRSILWSTGIVGHTWDWAIPHFSEQFKIQLWGKLFVWDPQSFGGKFSPFKIELPFWLLLSLLAPLGGEVISKLIPLVFLVIAAFSMYLLAKTNFGISVFWSTVAGIFYALSPYAYSRLIAGHLTILLGYAVLPLFVMFCTRLVQTPDTEYSRNKYLSDIFFLAFLSLLLTIHFGMMFVAFVIVVFYFVYSLINNWKEKRYIRFLRIIPLAFLVNLYWIVPIIHSFILTGEIRVRPDETITQEVARRVAYFESISQPAYRLITHQIPFGLHTEFIYPVESWGPVFVIISVFLFIAALSSSLLFKKGNNKLFLFLYIFFLFGLGISAGTKTIIGQEFYAILLKLTPPLFASFSNPLRFLPIVYLPLAILAVITMSEIEKRFWNHRFPFIKLGTFTLLLVYWYPWFFRPLTKPVVQNDSQPLSLKVTQTNSEDKKVFDSLAAEETDFRFVSLPPSFLSWPGETDHSFPWTSNLFPKSVFLQFPRQPLASVILSGLYSQDSSKDLGKLLGLGSVDTIIYPRYYYFESYQSFIPGTINYKPYVDRNWLIQSGIQKISNEMKTIDVYSNQYFVPHVFIPKQSTFIATSDKNALIDIVEQSDFNIRNAIFMPDSVRDDGTQRVTTVGMSDQVYVKPTCMGCKELIIPEYELHPVPRLLPTSPFYSLTRWKEQRLLKSAQNDEILYAKTILMMATKKIIETLAMIENNWETQISARQSLDIYLTLSKDFDALLEKIIKQGPSRGEELHSYTVFLNRNLKDLNKIVLTAKNGDIVQLAANARTYVYELLNKINTHIWYSSKPNDFRYVLSVPKAGKYQLYQKRQTDIEYPIDLKIDGKQLEQVSTGQDNLWQMVGVTNLSEGVSTLYVRMRQVPNLFAGFTNPDAVKVLPDDSYAIAGLPDVSSVTASIGGLNDRYMYRVFFEYIASGAPIHFTLGQDNDELYKGTTKHKIDMMLTQAGGWGEVEAEFAPNFGSNNATLNFYLQARDDSIPTLLIKNIRIERIYQPEFLLKLEQSSISLHNVPKITFTKINPTKYIVKVTNASAPYFLVFSESFHEGWKAFVSESGIKPSSRAQAEGNNESGNIVASYFGGEIQEGEHQNIFWDPKLFENVYKKPIPEENHLLVNAYANAWYIDKPGDYEITLEFVPQRTYFVALMISGVTFVAVVFSLGVLLIKKKRYGAN